MKMHVITTSTIKLREEIETKTIRIENKKYYWKATLS